MEVNHNSGRADAKLRGNIAETSALIHPCESGVPQSPQGGSAFDLQEYHSVLKGPIFACRETLCIPARYSALRCLGYRSGLDRRADVGRAHKIAFRKSEISRL